MRNSYYKCLGIFVFAQMFLLLGCEDSTEWNHFTHDKSDYEQATQKLLSLPEKPLISRLPNRLEDISYNVHCENGVCMELRDEMRILDVGEAVRLDYEHYDNVRLQRERSQEFKDLMSQTLMLKPLDCDEAPERYAENIVQVSIMLIEQPFDFTRYRDAGSDRKLVNALNNERIAQIVPVQERVGRRLESVNGNYMGGGFLSNTIYAELPVCALDIVAQWEEVITIEQVGEDKPMADGRQRRVALGLPVELPGPPASGLAGLDASQGGRRGGATRVRFGVIEADNPLNTSHLAFRNGVGSTTRIVDTDRCTFWFPSIRCINSATTTGDSHGTRVTGVLLGDLSDGQDPMITNALERVRRSGIAPEGEVHYYSSKGRPGTAAALDEAVRENGIDIVNMSMGPDGKGYCKNDSLNNVRERIEAATDAGVLVVVSAGNEGEVTGCNVNNYGTFPDSFTIGGTSKSYSLNALNTNYRASGSSWGTFDTTLYGGRKVNARLVDVMTNYWHNTMATSGLDGYESSPERRGTSYSAPSIAGLAGLLHHWVERRGTALGGLQNDPYAYRALLSVMADGRTHSSGQYSYSIDSSMGFGNVRFVDLDNDLGNVGGWAIRRVTMNPGAMYEWSVGSSAAESPLLNGFKFAALIDHNRYGNGPDVTFQLIDKCPTGGGQSVIMTAAPYPLKARMRVLSSNLDSQFRNRCIWVRATVNHAGGPVRAYMAHMYYSNARIYHDAP